jgi:hypothetical protein
MRPVDWSTHVAVLGARHPERDIRQRRSEVVLPV